MPPPMPVTRWQPTGFSARGGHQQGSPRGAANPRGRTGHPTSGSPAGNEPKLGRLRDVLRSGARAWIASVTRAEWGHVTVRWRELNTAPLSINTGHN